MGLPADSCLAMQVHQLDQQKGEMDARRAATSKEHTERLKVQGQLDARTIVG